MLFYLSMKTKIYTLPSCVQCNMTKNYLNKKGAEFETIDLSQEPDDVVAGFKSRGLMQAPIVVTDTDAWAGFNPGKLDTL